MKMFYLEKNTPTGCKTEKDTLTIKTHFKKVILSNYIWNWNFLLPQIN